MRALGSLQCCILSSFLLRCSCFAAARSCFIHQCVSLCASWDVAVLVLLLLSSVQ